MRSGDLQRRLKLQKLAVTVSSDGFSVENWIDLATVWADLSPLTAREIMQAGQQEEKITHQASIRYRTDIGTRMRFRYGNRIFQIHTILDTEEDHRELICLCEEVVTGQVANT